MIRIKVSLGDGKFLYKCGLQGKLVLWQDWPSQIRRENGEDFSAAAKFLKDNQEERGQSRKVSVPPSLVQSEWGS